MTILPLGDATLLVQLGTAIDEETQKRVRAAFEALAAARIAGAHDIVPAYTSVAVHYDPLRVPASRAGEDEAPWQRMRRIIAHVLDGAAADPADAARRPTVEIPVLYGGEYGPDLEHVARHTRMSPDDVVSLHAAAEYRVCMIGFTPGFPYLAGLPPQLATPRRASPRTRVPAGSVGIAGTQTGVYPLSTPGGWQIIGRTDVQLFQPDMEPPTSLRLGDTVRFVPVRAP